MEEPVQRTRERKITRVTLLGSFVNVLLTVAKIIAGVLGHSAAMIADGIHSLSDLISDIVVLICVRISSKGKDKDHKYGHGKYETMATLFVSLMLIFVAAKMCLTGLSAIIGVVQGKVIEVPHTIALWAAVASIIAKELLFRYTAKVGRDVSSPVVIANAWHHRTDALSSIGSALGIGGAILLGDEWVILDPIVCCGISVAIFVSAIQMGIPSLKELLEVALPQEMEEEMIAIASQVEGVESIHDLKTRRNGTSIIVDAHVVVSPDMTIVEAHNISTEVERSLREKYGQEIQTSIHVEPDEDSE
ncbi:MAG: cation transporter [Paludibacteraceae bacterium]|nr:cation transporter [Paludibacteraceae bacterium]MBP5481688.1 cation transporter [Paludibacteraceae bacterium]